MAESVINFRERILDAEKQVLVYLILHLERGLEGEEETIVTSLGSFPVPFCLRTQRMALTFQGSHKRLKNLI